MQAAVNINPHNVVEGRHIFQNNQQPVNQQYNFNSNNRASDNSKSQRSGLSPGNQRANKIRQKLKFDI
mgnify:CR=1 FL=1